MKTLILAITCLLSVIPCSADVIYVKEGGTGSGTNWTDPYGILQDALDDADPCDVIWVAEGIYYPTSDYGLGIGSRGNHFRMNNGVAIYGGFPNIGNPDMDDRDPNLYETILSGDIGVLNDNSDNCYHVFYHPDGTDLDPNAVLDGFTITGGNAEGPVDHQIGGGMYNFGSSPTVTNCKFTGNSAGDGGGMFNDSESNPTVTGCTFIGNWAVCGGGMMNYKSSPTLTSCTFIGNSVDYYGGGMWNVSESSTIVTNCTFTSNSALDGGGINNYYSSPTVTGCTFISNSAIDGGGMNNYESSPAINGCTFSNNSARPGGGIYNNQSSPTINGCTFSNNSARPGGGMYNWSSSPTVMNCIFSKNSSNKGGGLYNENSDMNLFNCTFSGNSAILYGGGMFNTEHGNTIAKNCVFNKNSAYDGGGIYQLGSSLTVENCVFSSNSAIRGPGGGIWGLAGFTKVTNCTFIDNSAVERGGGIAFDVLAINCILWGNKAPNGPQVTYGSNVIYSCVQGGYSGTGNIDADPEFVDPNGPDGVIGTQDDNLRLSKGSPCIDSGDNSVVDANSTDLDSNLRIMDGDGDGESIVDMGAYEALGPVEADVHIIPRVINRRSRMKRIFAIMRLPADIGSGDVADEPFVLEPAGLEASWQRVFGARRRAMVFMSFDKDDVMDALEDNGRVELDVVGELTSGQYVYGSDTVRIIQPRLRARRRLIGR